MNLSIEQLAIIISFLISVISIGIALGKILQKIKDLTEKVDKHNQVVERTYKLEANVGSLDLGVMAERINTNEKEIQELKQEIQKGCFPKCKTNMK